MFPLGARIDPAMGRRRGHGLNVRIFAYLKKSRSGPDSISLPDRLRIARDFASEPLRRNAIHDSSSGTKISDLEIDNRQRAGYRPLKGAGVWTDVSPGAWRWRNLIARAGSGSSRMWTESNLSDAPVEASIAMPTNPKSHPWNHHAPTRPAMAATIPKANEEAEKIAALAKNFGGTSGSLAG